MFMNPTARVTGRMRRPRGTAEAATRPSSRTCTIATVRIAMTKARNTTKPMMKTSPAWPP